jgi:hypothetical protein
MPTALPENHQPGLRLATPPAPVLGRAPPTPRRDPRPSEDPLHARPRDFQGGTNGDVAAILAIRVVGTNRDNCSYYVPFKGAPFKAFKGPAPVSTTFDLLLGL